jgi:hypothetical protein
MVELILERNNPQETAFNLFDRSPEAIAVVFPWISLIERLFFMV